LDDGEPADIVYLDFAKAFDKVPHSRLLKKVAAVGIDGKLLQWIKYWLSDRRQRVSVNKVLSGWKKVISGVPQGSVLGPLLFIIFINDLENNLTSKICKFSDDTKLCKKVGTDALVLEMQEDLNKLWDWSEVWEMKFNTKKCVVMHMGNKNKNNEYRVGNEQLEVVDNEKDLGVIVNSNGKYAEQCAQAVKQANCILGMIRRNIRHKAKDVITRLYKALVRPRLEYCFQVWCPHYKKDIESLEKVQKEL